MKKYLSLSGSPILGASVAKHPLLALALTFSVFASLSQPVKAAALIDRIILGDGDIAVSGPDVIINGDVHTNANFTTSGGSTITGLVSAVGTVTNDGFNPSFLLGGTAPGSAPRSYPNMSAVLAAIGVSPTEIFGNLIYSGSETFSGVYLVHGFVDISSDAPGNATFLAEGNIDISGGASITGVVLNGSFPFGLALYSSTGHVNLSDATVHGSVAAKTTVDVSGASQVPEPSSALLLTLGCLGAAVMRRRKNA